jgi:hypothetical protein
VLEAGRPPLATVLVAATTAASRWAASEVAWLLAETVKPLGTTQGTTVGTVGFLSCSRASLRSSKAFLTMGKTVFESVSRVLSG